MWPAASTIASPRILPALVDEAAVPVAGVLDQSVPIAIVEPIQPVERPIHVAPQVAEHVERARPRRVLAEEDEEQRRGVHRSVVGRLGDPAQSRQLAHPELVQDLARLLIAPAVDVGALAAGKEAQRGGRDGRLPGEGLIRGDERVATEQGREPGQPGAVVAVSVEVGSEDREVGKRAMDDAVEQPGVAVHGGRPGARTSLAPAGLTLVGDAAIRVRGVAARGCSRRCRLHGWCPGFHRLPDLEPELEGGGSAPGRDQRHHGPLAVTRRRRRVEGRAERAVDAIAAVVRGDEAVLLPGGPVTPAAGWLGQAADLVDVAKARGDVDADLQRRVVRPVVLDLEPVVEQSSIAVEGSRPAGGEDVLANRPAVRQRQLGIGQLEDRGRSRRGRRAE